MTRRESGRRTTHGRGRVLVFGESTNDTAALRELAEALKPSLAGRVQTKRQPLVLMKNSKPDKVPGRAAKIIAVVRAEMENGPVCGVLAHEDCDATEPSDLAVVAKIEQALSGLPVKVHAVVPAWELEAWWFLWPEAVAAVQASWRKPDDYVGRRVGLIENAKEELSRRIVPRTRKPHRVCGYTEADSVRIARKVKELGLANSPQAQSTSYERFRACLSTCEG